MIVVVAKSIAVVALCVVLSTHFSRKPFFCRRLFVVVVVAVVVVILAKSIAVVVVLCCSANTFLAQAVVPSAAVLFCQQTHFSRNADQAMQLKQCRSSNADE
jgi:hypothetical protein